LRIKFFIQRRNWAKRALLKQAKAESVLMDILKSHDRVLDDPEPMVHLHTLGASSVDFVVRPWVKVDDDWDVYWDVTRTVKLRFDEEGICIPFPQQDLHIYQGEPLAPAEALPLHIHPAEKEVV
jgi:small-conductance mechanosensitive channel